MREFKKKNHIVVNGNCWIAYFDILGFKGILQEFEDKLDIFVQEYYEDILKEVDKRVSYWPEHVTTAWASDSFLFFTYDDSLESFACINQVARHFFIGLIWKQMPSRGALNTGRLYADHNSNAYIGSGLVDAYKYSEKQDWIGFVLAPSVEERLNGTDLSGYLDHESDFIKYDIPVKEKEYMNGTIQTKPAYEKLYAYKFTNLPYTEEPIREMYQITKNKFGKDCEHIYNKYENTIRFIKYMKQKPCAKS